MTILFTLVIALVLQGASSRSHHVIYDDGFLITAPYVGIRTTALDPYEEGEDCNFRDNIFPHVLSQCDCFETIDILPNDTRSLYNDLREDIAGEFYDGIYNEPVNSCDPANQALVWLASGNTRDSGDLYQRYIMAVAYFQMNGTKWDVQNLWLSDESECIWYSLQCNSRFQLNSFALDSMNVHGSFPTEIGRLSGLRVLAFSRNHLTGAIPSEIILMDKLEVVSNIDTFY
jgi:hypothetical protein